MVYCTVCMNNTRKNKNVSYFNYPKDYNRRHDWLKAVGREDLLLKLVDDKTRQQYRICEDHFEKNCIKFSKNRTVKYLYDYAFPTLKLPSNEGVSSSSIQENAFPAVNLPSNTGANLNKFANVSEQEKQELQLLPTCEIPSNSNNFSNKIGYLEDTMRSIKTESDMQICTNRSAQTALHLSADRLSDVFEGQSSSGTGESNTKGRATTCRSTKLIPLLKSAEDIIASVYNYLKAEYKHLKSSIGANCDLSPLANILERTAAATGVSEQTVSAILDERKRSADEELDAGVAKRAKLSHDYGDGNVSPITDDESSCEAPDTEQDHVTEQDENNEQTQASQEPEVETLKVEIKEENILINDKPVDSLLIQMNETDSAVQHLLFSSNSNRSNISIATDTNSAQVRKPPAVVVHPQSRSGVQRVMSQEPLSSLATVKIEPIDDAHYSSEVKTEPPPS